MNFNKTKKRSIFITLILLFISSIIYSATTFTENFTTDNFKDNSATTANWDTVNNQGILLREPRFAETTGVINWGGGIEAIKYDGTGTWVIAGDGGKINSYDGLHFVNLSVEAGFGTDNIYAVWHNGSSWLIGGAGGKVKGWNGTTTWTDYSAGLQNFSGDVRAIGYKNTPTTYWLVGGTSGSLNSFNGTTWTDLKTQLNFGTNDVLAVKWNGSYWLIAGKGGKIVKYDGSTTWSDYSSVLATALGGTYDINTIEWNGTSWLIGGGGKIASSTDGQNFTNKSGSITMSAVYNINGTAVTG